MSLKSCICGSDKRKFFYGAASFIAVFVFILTLAITVGRVGKPVPFILDRTPLFAGPNNLPELLNKIRSNLSVLNFNENLTEYYLNSSCFNCNTDLVRLKKGKVSSQMLVLQTECGNDDISLAKVLSQIITVKDFLNMYDEMKLITRSEDLAHVFVGKKIGNLLSIDGGEAIHSDINMIQIFYNLGVRVMALSSGCDTSWISGYKGNNAIGLSEMARTVIKEMNDKGIIIDLTGLSQNVMNEVLNISKTPVIFSHSAAFTMFNKSAANVPDDTIQALKRNGGIFMITFDSEFLAVENATINTVVDHLNYIVGIVGFESVGIGGNFDSSGKKAEGLKDVSSFPKLFELLKDSNPRWSDNKNLDNLAHYNFLRVFKEVEKYSEELQYLKQRSMFP